MMKNSNGNVDVRENVFAGAVGALLFSLVGGIIWFLLWQVGFIAGISGAIGVICAIKGYTVFGKKESIKGVVISIIMTVLVMILAWYFCLALDVYNAYKEWFDEGFIDFTITFGEAVQNAYIFLEEPEIGPEYIKDLVIGLVFCAIGGIGYVKGTVKRVKENKEGNANTTSQLECADLNQTAFDEQGYTYTRLNGESTVLDKDE